MPGNLGNFSASLPNCFIGDLLFHPNVRLLHAGTLNRSVWDIDRRATYDADLRRSGGTLAANETKRWFTFDWPASWHIV
jgi:hypothetical protein